MSSSSRSPRSPCDIPSFSITACRGLSGDACRYALACDNDLVKKIGAVMDDSGWDSFLRSAVHGSLKHHHAFKIAVAACPNGCSRPHIADIGFIRACVPAVDLSKCSQCGVCEKICPDEAVKIEEAGPRFDESKCMKCGLCVARCKDQALQCAESGYRIVLGGRLGRNPQLAVELAGLFCADECVAALGAAVAFYMQNYRAGLRFGALMNERGGDLLCRPEFSSQ